MNYDNISPEAWLKDVKLFKFLSQTVFVVCIVIGIMTNVSWLPLGVVMIVLGLIIGSLVSHEDKLIDKIKKKKFLRNSEIRIENDRKLHNSAYGDWLRDRTTKKLGSSIKNIMYNGFPCDISNDGVIGYSSDNAPNESVMLLQSTSHGFMYIIKNNKCHYRTKSRIVWYLSGSGVQSLSTSKREILADIANYGIKFVSDKKIEIGDIVGIDDVNIPNHVIAEITINNAMA